MNSANRPTAIIADDEPRLAEFLAGRLAALWPELMIVGVAANGPEAQAMLAAEAPDIAFLDIRMPGLTGLEVARVRRRTRARRVRHGVRPICGRRFRPRGRRLPVEAGQRRASRRNRRAAQVEAAGAVAGAGTAGRARGHREIRAAARRRGRWPERLAWIRASAGAQVKLIAVDDVSYFQANDKYTSVFTAEGEALIRTPLKELGEQLDPDRFWQVHRGTIVNVRHVSTTVRDLTGRVTLTLKNRPEKVAVSRAYAHLFKQM